VFAVVRRCSLVFGAHARPYDGSVRGGRLSVTGLRVPAMVHHITERPRPAPPGPSLSFDAFLDASVAARLPEHASGDSCATPRPAADEARRLAGHAVRLAALGEESRLRVLAQLTAALGEESRARVNAYLDVPFGPGLGEERAAALDAARRTAGAWPDEAGQEFTSPQESGYAIPVPRSMSEAEALELADCVVGLAPLDAAARARVLAYLNSLFATGV
jgi:hypothetical protein